MIWSVIGGNWYLICLKYYAFCVCVCLCMQMINSSRAKMKRNESKQKVYILTQMADLRFGSHAKLFVCRLSTITHQLTHCVCVCVMIYFNFSIRTQTHSHLHKRAQKWSVTLKWFKSFISSLVFLLLSLFFSLKYKFSYFIFFYNFIFGRWSYSPSLCDDSMFCSLISCAHESIYK